METTELIDMIEIKSLEEQIMDKIKCLELANALEECLETMKED